MIQRILCLFALVALQLSSAIEAGAYSAKTHFYAVEYLKPGPAPDAVSMLNVTFNRKVEAKVAERILREEIQRTIVLFPPKATLMAYAWSETDPTPGSE